MVELMNVFLIVNIRPSLIHLHGLELLVVLSQKSLLFCTNRVSLVNLKWNSDRLLIVTKGFLKLLNQLVQIKLRWGELDNPGISSSACLCRTNLELHNNHVTLKLAKKVTSELDLLKAPGPDYVPVVVLEKCESELSYILHEFFSNCLKEYFFPNFWKLWSGPSICDS